MPRAGLTKAVAPAVQPLLGGEVRQDLVGAQRDAHGAALVVEGDELVLNLVAPLQLLGGVVLALVVERDELQHTVPPDELEPRPSLSKARRANV